MHKKGGDPTEKTSGDESGDSGDPQSSVKMPNSEISAISSHPVPNIPEKE